MGKSQSPKLNAITEMNGGKHSPNSTNGLSTELSEAENGVETVCLFTNFEDVEALKDRMKEVVLTVDNSRRTSSDSKSTTHQSRNDDSVIQRLEMSSSLPNLSLITEKGSEILNKLSQKIISTSAADVRKSVSASNPSPDSVKEEEVDSHHDDSNVPSAVENLELKGTQLATKTAVGSGNGEVMNNGSCPSPSKCQQTPCAKHRNTDTDETTHNNTSPGSDSSSNTLVINIDASNSRLSSVLENVPLVYLPKTKQLVTSQHNCDSISTCTMQCGCETSSQFSDEPLTESTVISSADDSERFSGPSTVSLMNTSFSSASNLLDISVTSSTALLDYDENEEVKDTVAEDDLGATLTDSPRSTLPRSTTAGSLGQTDTSSYSSISSLSFGNGADLSANASISDEFNLELRNSANSEFDDAGFMEVNLDGRNSFEKCRNPSQDSGIADGQGNDPSGAKPKRSGLSGFFTRGLFFRKPKDQDSPPGWKLFGKVPPKQAPPKNPSQITEEYQANQRALARKKDIEVTSTTALILEQRPSGLPCKSPQEELKHKQQYEAMVEAAKKKELKEAKQKKKQMQQQLKQEQLMTQALQVWNKDILPNWECMSASKKARDLWWIGLPPSVRGKVWTLAIGNELNITSELYEICVSRAEDRIRIMREGDSDSICSNEPASSKEASVDLIKLDVSRTFPQLCIFQKGGPYYDLLHSLLGAYACYRPDVGYVQGMSFIAAVLLLNMDVADAFVCFANLLNRPCQVTFFRMDESMMKAYFETYEELFEENLPRLYTHFCKQKLTPDLYIIDWMFTLFSKSLPLDVASRVWDVFCRDGEEFLFRTALGILKLHEEVLLNLDFIHLAQFLTRLPENISSEDLFKNIRQIEMTVDNRKFGQVLASNRDNHKDS